MGLADYLAKNYLSADAPKDKSSKKRKRKDKAAGLIFAEDDVDTWKKPTEQEDDDDAPTITGTTLTSGLNKPVKKSKFIRIGAEAPSNADQAAADAILADAAAESNARAQADDDAPAIVDENGEDVDGQQMASGAMAGLQTAEQVTKALKRREKAERKAMEAAGLDPTGKAHETVYRDASGRRIDVAMKRAEARKQAEEEERKKAEELESRKGDVQRREKEDRKLELEEAKVMPVARHADDKKLNDELKEKERWNDPMAQLLGSKKSSKAGKANKKTYQGASEPNRYGIRPGFRWDGVDRGNGFERKWFAARNKAKDRQELEYMWQMDE